MSEFERADLAYYGYRGAVVRVGERMPWAGYVYVPKGHRWHGQHPDDISVVQIPGGITYSAPDEDDPDGAWAVGFDLGHVSVLTEYARKVDAIGHVATLAAQAATVGATWSDERPAEDGAYWWRQGVGYAPRVARVEAPFGEQILSGNGYVRLHDDAGGQWAQCREVGR